jgi:aspartyl-tRNA(Asn)/glutamyl-tRNA(Gln) amidotransferase subunit C
MADPIKLSEVIAIAELAHLSLGPGEADDMARELAVILGYVRQLEELDLEGVAPTTSLLGRVTELRADVPEAELDREVSLGEAPSVVDGGFAVPSFVDEG